MVRVADDEGDGHGFAKCPPQAEQNAAEHADARIGEHDAPHHFARRRAERIGALAQYGRHRLEHIAHDRRDERQHHDREDESRCEDSDAERRSLEQQTNSRNRAERVDQCRLDMLLHKGRQDKQAPDPIDDARDRREQFDHDRQRPLQPVRA